MRGKRSTIAREKIDGRRRGWSGIRYIQYFPTSCPQQQHDKQKLGLTALMNNQHCTVYLVLQRLSNGRPGQGPRLPTLQNQLETLSSPNFPSSQCSGAGTGSLCAEATITLIHLFT